MQSLDERTSHFLYSSLLILLGYFCIGWSCLYIFNFQKFHFLDLYFLPSFLVMFITLCYQLVKNKSFKLTPSLEKRELVFVLLTASLFILTRYLKIDEMRLWLDEYTQFLYGAQTKGESLLEFSFYEQQPPLDYMLSGFAKQLFGFSVVALKFHTLLFSLLFYLALPLCFRILTQSVWPRYSVVWILVMCRPLLAYSMEARPLMISLFFSLLSLTFLVNCLLRKDRLSFIATLITFFVYTTTTGLQPQLFLLVLCLGFFGFEKSQKWKSISLGFFAFLYNLPVIYYLIDYTDRTNQFNSTLFEKVSLIFTKKAFEEITNIIRWDPFLLVILCGVIGFFSLYSFFRETNSLKRRLKITLILLPFVYLLTYVIFYYSFISWVFAIRYTFNFYSAFAFFLLLGTIKIFQGLERTTIKATLVILIGTFIWGSYRAVAHPLVWYIASAQRPQWDSIYQKLDGVLKPDDRIIKFTLTNIGNWRGDIFVGQEFFSSEQVTNKTLGYYVLSGDVTETLFCDPNFDYLKPSSGRLYIVFDPLRITKPVDSIEIDSMDFKREESFEIMTLYSLAIENNLYFTIKRYFNLLLERYRGYEATAPLLESMFCLEKFYGSKEGYLEYLKMYKSIAPDQTWSNSGLYYNKKEEIKKRIKYFSKIMDETWK